MKNDIAIQLDHVSKKYEIHHEKPTLVEKFVKRKNETFWAIKDISFVVKKGERVGIIGRNGSGKTTLLKIITGITNPNVGTRHVQGKIVSLIDLEAGFHQDLTGEQNIYLNGMLLGMKKDEISRKIDPIIKFADIGSFIDTPLFTYSSGMKLRLGFAVAVHANPDILILDEGLSVGDIDFQKKCQRQISELLRKKKTLLLVTHSLPLIQQVCHRVLLLRHGRLHQDGLAMDVIKKYEKRI